MKISSDDIYIGSEVWYFTDLDDDYSIGKVIDILPYDKEVGVPHFIIEGAKHPVSLVNICKVDNTDADMEATENAKKSKYTVGDILEELNWARKEIDRLNKEIERLKNDR